MSALVSQYPIPEVGGPKFESFSPVPLDVKIVKYTYDGGGASFNVQPCGVGRWIIKYTGISTDEFNLLRDHLNLAKGRTNYFDLISVREAVIWHGVQYEKWETVPHEKNWLRNVTVTLIKLK